MVLGSFPNWTAGRECLGRGGPVGAEECRRRPVGGKVAEVAFPLPVVL